MSPPQRNVTNSNGFGNTNTSNTVASTSLKIHKDSHSIKKPLSPLPSPPPSSSSSTSSCHGGDRAAKPPQQQTRRPVIIYTHSPKVIHTHPRDFMALVQKLTGLSRSPHGGDSSNPPQPAEAAGGGKCGKGAAADDTESVVTTDESCGGSRGGGMGDLTCMVPPFLDTPPPMPSYNYLPAIPFPPNAAAELFCSAPQPPPFYGCNEPLIFGGGMLGRRSISPSSTLDGTSEFREY